MTSTAGVVGLGIMGSAFAANLLEAGFQVVGYDLESARLAELAERGGTAAANPGAVVDRADVTILSLPSAPALADVVAAAAKPRSGDRILLECSTLALADKQQARDALAVAGITLLDCPISGTGPHAATRDIVVFGSGDAEAYARATPVIEAIAKTHRHLGPFGDGTKVKMVANHLVQVHTAGAAEALVLAAKAGLDPALAHEVISRGPASSRMFDLRGAMMVKHTYEPAMMKNAMWQKDMRLITEFAAALDCPTPLFAAGTPLFAATVEQHRGDQDMAAVHAVMEQLARVKRDGS